jgi:hypothetical protein
LIDFEENDIGLLNGEKSYFSQCDRNSDGKLDVDEYNASCFLFLVIGVADPHAAGIQHTFSRPYETPVPRKSTGAS